MVFLKYKEIQDASGDDEGVSFKDMQRLMVFARLLLEEQRAVLVLWMNEKGQASAAEITEEAKEKKGAGNKHRWSPAPRRRWTHCPRTRGSLLCGAIVCGFACDSVGVGFEQGLGGTRRLCRGVVALLVSACIPDPSSRCSMQYRICRVRAHRLAQRRPSPKVAAISAMDILPAGLMIPPCSGAPAVIVMVACYCLALCWHVLHVSWLDRGTPMACAFSVDVSLLRC